MAHLITVLLAVSAIQPNNAATLEANHDASQSPNTAVAMIVLYAVTGCVSFLFFLIIITGAIRAIRYPERYGPRANRDGDDQTRARGLTRAILDTFPIVKFGNKPEPEAPPKDIQAGPAVNLPEMNLENRPSTRGPSVRHNPEGCSSPDAGEGNARPGTPPIAHRADMGPLSILGSSSQPSNYIPDSIGRETCPICIVDFEEGDDLRVLPCDGAHCFHQTCVDPWLLELSTACPICRQDFIALENMISGRLQDADPSHNSNRVRRFSQYLRFAKHPRQRDSTHSTGL
ncbi:hypothetical protein FB451DRAFT_1210962 [Mycena latifolia]|nr:hypothetical protein FB451DRAFT_1210962 [Mycena latifolia]